MLRRAAVVGLLLVIVCGTGVTALGSGPPSPQSAATAPPANPFGTQPADFEQTEFVITLYANGTAEWMHRHTKPLNESTRADFEAYAENFNTNQTDLYQRFVSGGIGLAADGENTTGREMAAEGFSRQAYVQEDQFTQSLQGVVEMRFRWTNFSQQSGDQIVMGDLFERGLYLGANQELLVRAGPTLSFSEVQPSGDSRENITSLEASEWVAWQGQYDFNNGQPRAVLEPASTGPTVTPTATTTTTATTPTLTRSATPSGNDTTTPPAGASGDGGMSMLVVAVILLVLGVGTAAVWRIAGGTDDDSDTATETDDGGPGPGPEGPPQPTGAATTTESEAESVEESEPAVSADELVSDTDRVEQLLEDHGGRMRQSAIVEETDWSKSKVSMLLSDMEDEDEITKLRVGRENIISLPGHEPEAAGSPFDDEE